MRMEKYEKNDFLYINAFLTHFWASLKVNNYVLYVV